MSEPAVKKNTIAAALAEGSLASEGDASLLTGAYSVKSIHSKRATIDFFKSAQQIGYLKTRQKKKQQSISEHLVTIAKIETTTVAKKAPLRLKESIRLGSTTGLPSKEQTYDKIMAQANSKPTPEEGQSMEEATRRFDEETSLRMCMLSESRELLVAQMGLESLPFAMGSTLFLQTGFLKGLSLTQNKMTGLLTTEVPQLSMRHLRYVRNINLSGNKIQKLPADIGVLQMLEVLDVSMNALSELPETISKIGTLQTINLAKNMFNNISDNIAQISSLTSLNLSDNSFTNIPVTVVRIKNLKIFIISKNSLAHMAVLHPLLKPKDMWTTVIDHRTGKLIFMNLLTKEKVKVIEDYDGKGIERDRFLHEFQTDPNSRSYRRRKMWLSCCQIHEWEPCEDIETNLIYYRNNVSGVTTWTIPPDIDTLGDIEFLEEIYINSNCIKDVCPSFPKLKNLKKAILYDNRFKELPKDIDGLVSLEELDLHGCDLKLLPVSICKCTNLTKLNVQANQLIRLPDLLGTLPKLQKLDCAANRMTRLPYSLGYSKTLTDFLAIENPLEDPPPDELNKGLDQLKWYLRQRLMIDNRGMPPPMEFHEISVGHEVTILKPELIDSLMSVINVSHTTGFLNLQLMGLKEIPVEVLKLRKLKRLRFDFNDRMDLHKKGIPEELGGLRMLSFKSCKMDYMPDNVHNLKRITTFILEENKFEELPPSFTKLRTLTNLDISKNRLYNLPANFESLLNLRTLNLESNNIEIMPPALGRITSLQTINLSKNRIRDLPDLFCDMSQLKKLNLEGNKLTCLPTRIKIMRLVELRVGHNNIEILPDDMFSESLGMSCKVFSFCENNLLEVPSSLHRLDPEAHIEADFNPFRSPPQYILSENFKVLQNYLFIREQRLEELVSGLTDADFVMEKSSAKPVAADCLVDGTGYLTPEDLLEFDIAVDEFINAEYYKCPASGAELVASIVKLREYRETELYLTILRTMLGVIDNLFKTKDKRFTDAVIFKSYRPWGRKSEKIPVWCISLNALLRDTPPNKLQRKGRPSLLSMVKEALPPMPFPFTVDMLKDSLRLYLSPYGQVGDTVQETFPSCDCIDDRTKKPKKHAECKKTSVVVARSIYTDEEADRREWEEDEFINKFEEIENDIKIFFETEKGKAAREKEVKSRLANLYEDISLRQELMDVETMKAAKALREKNIVADAKKRYLQSPDDNHDFKSIEEMNEKVKATEDAFDQVSIRIETLQKQINELIRESKKPLVIRRLKAEDELVQKYCIKYYFRTIKRYRQLASQNGLNRHWDGEDGIYYKEWYKKFGGIKTGGDKVPNDMKGLVEMIKEEDEVYRKKELADAEAEGKLDGPEYDWSETEDMSKWESYIWHRFKGSKLVNLADMANAGFDIFSKGLSMIGINM